MWKRRQGFEERAGRPVPWEFQGLQRLGEPIHELEDERLDDVQISLHVYREVLDTWHTADNVVDVLSEGGTWDGVGICVGKGDVEGSDPGVHEEDATVKEREFRGPNPLKVSERREEVAVFPDMEGSEAGEGVEEEDIALVGVVERERLDALAVLVEAAPVAFGGETLQVLRKEANKQRQYLAAESMKGEKGRTSLLCFSSYPFDASRLNKGRRSVCVSQR